MSRLGSLIDKFEGTLPYKTRKSMIRQPLGLENNVRGRPELQKQLAGMTDRNVTDGRDVLVVNCWFLGETESQQMWNEYVGSSEGVALRSTLKRLDQKHTGKAGIYYYREGQVRGFLRA